MVDARVGAGIARCVGRALFSSEQSQDVPIGSGGSSPPPHTNFCQ